MIGINTIEPNVSFRLDQFAHYRNMDNGTFTILTVDQRY